MPVKIVVCVKQTVDTEAVIELDEKENVVQGAQSLIIDPSSEFAVEKAVRIKEEQGGEVIAVSVAGCEAVPVLRHALAMGADEACLIDDEACRTIDSTGKASVLAAAIKRFAPDLVMGGCMSADTASAQVLPRLAVILDYALVNVVTDLDVCGRRVNVLREIDDGFETVEVVLPAVIGAQQGLAEPRYPNVRDIMQSKKKPLTVMTLADLSVAPSSIGANTRKVTTVTRRLKPPRSGGRILAGELEDVACEVVLSVMDQAVLR